MVMSLFTFKFLISVLLLNLSTTLTEQVRSSNSEECSTENNDILSSSPSQNEKDVIINAIISSTPESIDPTRLTNIYQELKSRNAHKCWHKHSTFLEHLSSVHNILRLWKQGRDASLVGLLHSAYSNSYVNLALFDPKSERHVMQNLIGVEAEDSVYLFCSINRQDIVVNTLLKGGYIPQEGLHVQHLHDATKQVYLSPNLLRQLLIFTMADIADQYFGWQDELFGMGMLVPKEGDDLKMNSKSLWPGISKPGLWLSYVSELCKVVKTYYSINDTNDVAMPLLPPVFQNCTKTISKEHETQSRDLYWNVITEVVINRNDMISSLEECISLNPFVAEPMIVLGQVYLHENDFDKAMYQLQNAINLLESWGTVWDKRMSYGAWLAWSKVMLNRAREGLAWPESSWEVNNWGLVSE